jgi:hypothetical protein
MAKKEIVPTIGLLKTAPKECLANPTKQQMSADKVSVHQRCRSTCNYIRNNPEWKERFWKTGSPWATTTSPPPALRASPWPRGPAGGIPQFHIAVRFAAGAWHQADTTGIDRLGGQVHDVRLRGEVCIRGGNLD